MVGGEGLKVSNGEKMVKDYYMVYFKSIIISLKFLRFGSLINAGYSVIDEQGYSGSERDMLKSQHGYSGYFGHPT